MIDQNAVRQRAFQIWVAQGRPQGRDKEHWRQAEAEVLADRARLRRILDLTLAAKECDLSDTGKDAEDL
jgi:hypothetical protein